MGKERLWGVLIGDDREEIIGINTIHDL